MLKQLIAIVSGVAAVAVLSALAYSPPDASNPDQEVKTATESTAFSKADCKPQIQAGDILADIQNLSYRGYLIQKLMKKVRADVPAAYGKSSLVDVSYLTLRRHGKVIGKFDSGFFFILGNSTEVGFFSLLDNGRKQLVISQDVPKGGRQWVVDLDQGMKVIFDGQKFAVGREAYDMTITDLDGDQIFEIIVPICDFYGFESSRITTSETPLPSIVFKFDAKKRQYLPANVLLKEQLLKDIEAAETMLRSNNGREASLGDLMSVLLDYIFVGEEQRGWKFFVETYRLPDRDKIKSDIQEVLDRHPVYRYLKNPTAFTKPPAGT